MTIFEEKNIFKTLLQGIPNLEAKIFERYTSPKKEERKKRFEIPWLMEMPLESEIYEACARK